MSYRSAQDPEENLPDWLKALRKRQSDEGREGDPEPNAPIPPESDETGGGSVEPSEEVDEGQGGESFEPTEETDEEPEWLREIRSRYRRDKGPESEEVPETPALSDTQPHRATRPEPSPPDETEEPEPEPVLVEPDWLDAAVEVSRGEDESPAPEAEPEQLSQVPAFPEGEGAISPGELPSWLQALRPGGNFPKEDSRSGEMLPGGEMPPTEEETAGPLAGLSDVLPAGQDAAGLSKPPTFSARLDVTEQQRLHAAALKQLIDNEAKAQDAESQQVALPLRLLSTVIAAVLFLAVLFPLATQSESTPRPEVDDFPEAADVFNAIDVLPSGAPVLVAFEVQPSLAGEITPAAASVLAHLLDKQARLTFISTQPTGPALAERLLAEELDGQPAVATGEYSQMGYLSGGMAAIRSFLGEAGGDFALVIVIASDAEDARAWIEQGAGLLPNGLLAVTSAQANPLLRAYLQCDPTTLRGLVSGLQGAALYERMRGQDGAGRAYWDAYSYGLGAIVLLILFGGLYGRLTLLRPKTETTGNPNAA